MNKYHEQPTKNTEKHWSTEMTKICQIVQIWIKFTLKKIYIYLLF